MSKNEQGFTLVEALIAMGIVAFVIVSILNAFVHQMHVNRNTHLKNIAITLAEDRLEEYLKFPSTDMLADSVDYIWYDGNKNPVVTTSDPQNNDQFRRTTTVTPGGNLCRVRVVVEYGYSKADDIYPFRLELSTQRGL